jgi:molecular chaperone DnaK (HSP70)
MTECFGLDLGTSNCAVAVASLDAEPQIIPVPQVVTSAGIAEADLLPSAVYLPAAGEFPEGLPALAWESARRDWFLGRFARERGALQPDRLILSAKSWLCHTQIDRRTPVLPWGSDVVAEKWSPVDVSTRLLAHIAGALRQSNHALSQDGANLVVTVPASFDEVARSLTLEAAAAAGLGALTLLEEPQAAFYAWLESQGNNWRHQVKAGDLLLVADVGGGTTDFSLIVVTENDGDLGLERVAVGEHLLLGGDNLDLSLAHEIAESIDAAGTQLDEWQFAALVQAVRPAKEKLLAAGAPESLPLAIPSRGRKLVAGTVRAELSRSAVLAVAVEGFLPKIEPTDFPAIRRAGGLREAGLPFATDPAISKHLARFLHRSTENARATPALCKIPGIADRLANSGLLWPDAVLFNGGVFHAPVLRERLLELLGQWAGREVRELAGARPDHAVAIGAAAYARLRATGQGLRIKSGTARSYYIGMETATLAVPGRRAPVKALCVAPQGMEEGTALQLHGETFYLYTGEASEFRFFQTESRGADAMGALLPNATDLEEIACLTAAIPPPPGHPAGEEIPVCLEASVTELGNLELFFVHAPTGERWKLEFGVRLE